MAKGDSQLLERIAARHLVVFLKQRVKADAVTVRSAKRAVRELQRAGVSKKNPAQAGLAALRREVRARLLVYGFARGRSWAVMERHHAEGDASLEYHLLDVWREAERAAAQIAGALPPMPEALKAHLPRGSA